MDELAGASMYGCDEVLDVNYCKDPETDSDTIIRSPERE